jgi:hypothetical protein
MSRITDLISALTGNATTKDVTAQNTPAANDNSQKVATTSWLYSGAMTYIAQAAGFAVSAGSTGYIKFPAWLGGLVIQWGVATSASTSGTITFPLAFPAACLWRMAVNTDGNVTVAGADGKTVCIYDAPNTTTMKWFCTDAGGALNTPSEFSWFAIGN